MEPDNYVAHKEHFEVVCMKVGVSEMTAKPSDFKRVPVDADSPLAAVLSVSEKGWNVLFATRADVMTEPEILARRREMEGNFDRSKI